MRATALACVAACLACAAAAGAGAAPPAAAPPATRPSRAVTQQAPPTPTSAAPAAGAAPQPAATRPVRSEIGQRLIRREGAAASAQTRPASAAATTRPSVPAPPAVDLPKLAGALGIVLTLIFALRAVFKHVFPSSTAAGATRAVQVLSRSILSPKQQLVLVRVGRRLIVVADSGGQMSALSEITDPDEVASLLGQIKDEKLSAAAPTFGGLLGRVRRGMETADDAADHGAPEEATNPDAIGADIRHPGEEDDAEVSSTRRELDGLLAKVRLISHQFNGRPG